MRTIKMLDYQKLRRRFHISLNEHSPGGNGYETIVENDRRTHFKNRYYEPFSEIFDLFAPWFRSWMI